MKLSPNDIATLYSRFVDQEIAPKASSGLQRFIAYGSVWMVQKRVQDYLSDPSRVETLKTSGIMTQDGYIDGDYVKEMASYAMQKSGGKIQAMGLIFDQSDIDKVYNMGQSISI